jgi:hypothetical protein
VTAKAIQVVILARVKVDEGSGSRAHEKEERGGAKERLLLYEPAPNSFYTQAGYNTAIYINHAISWFVRTRVQRKTTPHGY